MHLLLNLVEPLPHLVAELESHLEPLHQQVAPQELAVLLQLQAFPEPVVLRLSVAVQQALRKSVSSKLLFKN